MKPILIRLAIMLGCVPAFIPALAADQTDQEVTRLTLVYTNGTETHFNLKDMPEVTFDGINMVVKTPAVETSVPRADIKHFHFTKGEPIVGIEDAMDDTDVEFTYINNVVTVTGANVNGLTVYDLSGRMVAQVPASDGSATANLSDLQSGVYVITANGLSAIKVVKN